MKRHLMPVNRIFAIALALALSTNLAAAERDATAGSDDARLSDEERAEIVALLEATQRDLLERVAGMSKKAFHHKSTPETWSVAEIVEHLVIVERNVLDGVEKAIAAPANPQWANDTAGTTDRIYRLVPNRVRRFKAPESVQPSGKMSRKQLISTFEELRARSIATIRDSAKPLKAHTTEHPVLGTLGVDQWILFAGLHNLRHNQQAVEVMADPGFPH